MLVVDPDDVVPDALFVADGTDVIAVGAEVIAVGAEVMAVGAEVIPVGTACTVGPPPLAVPAVEPAGPVTTVVALPVGTVTVLVDEALPPVVKPPVAGVVTELVTGCGAEAPLLTTRGGAPSGRMQTTSRFEQ